MNELERPPPTTPARLGATHPRLRALMGRLEHALGLDCQLFTRLDSDRNERPLGLLERLRYSLHGAICAICRLQRIRQQQLRTLAREPLDGPGPALSDEAKARIRDAMEAARRR
jgi:hypothetical protein